MIKKSGIVFQNLIYIFIFHFIICLLHIKLNLDYKYNNLYTK